MTDEQMLIRIPEFHRLVLESLAEYAVFTVSKENIITSWNKGAERVLLYDANEIMGKSGSVLFTPEDVEMNAPEVEFTTALREGKAINERFHLKKGGIKFWGSGLVFPLYNDEDEHIGFAKVMRNISEMEEAETNLKEELALAKTIASTTEDPVVILNTRMEVISASSAFIKFFSLHKSPITGRDLYSIIDGGLNLAELRSNLENGLKEHKFYDDFEVSYLHPQYGMRSLMVKLRRIYQPPNLLFKLEFDDLTENMEKLRAKDTFISIVAHEVKTPISIIKAYSQILDRQLKEASPDLRRAIGRINEQIKNLQSLAAALLDTTKITTGNLTLDREVMNISGLIVETVEEINLTVPTHKIIIETAADKLVLADKLRLRTVLVNLLSNAIKYSPNADKVIVRVEEENELVKVSVQDFGFGIPEREQHVLFQQFGRTESTKKSRITGFGLGLHLSFEIIKMHGGDIGFTTKDGEGSVFYFVLPSYE